MLVRLVLRKASVPIFVSDAGNVIAFSAAQSLKASWPIVCSVGVPVKLTFDRLLQPLKALSPTVLTSGPMVISVSHLALVKALLLMFFVNAKVPSAMFEATGVPP